MLGGLASRRGGNDGNDMMAASVVEPSAHRFDQHHQDMNVSQSQSNFNPGAFGMLGSSGQQPNMNSLSSLQGKSTLPCECPMYFNLLLQTLLKKKNQNYHLVLLDVSLSLVHCYPVLSLIHI